MQPFERMNLSSRSISSPPGIFRSTLTRWALGGVLTLSGLVPLGCFTGADLDDSTRYLPVSSSYPSAACAEIVFSKCGGAICHTGDGTEPPPGGVELTSPGYPARLYNQPAQYPGIAASATCPPAVPEKLVDPAGVEASLLWKKISASHTCGDAMPPIGDALEQSEVNCLQSLISEIIASPPAM